MVTLQLVAVGQGNGASGTLERSVWRRGGIGGWDASCWMCCGPSGDESQHSLGCVLSQVRAVGCLEARGAAGRGASGGAGSPSLQVWGGGPFQPPFWVWLQVQPRGEPHFPACTQSADVAGPCDQLDISPHVWPALGSAGLKTKHGWAGTSGKLFLSLVSSSYL